MTQEEKELLLKDLCARLPYGVKVTNGIHKITLTPCSDTSIIINEHILPYLRPMSSMTEEEKKELERLIDEKLNGNIGQENDEWVPWVLHDTTGIKNFIGGERFYFDEMSFIYDWLNAHYFDFRGLIEKNLALEAPEDIYK